MESNPLTLETPAKLYGVIEGMARYHNQTPERFVIESMQAHVEGILDNPRICGDELTTELRKSYGWKR
jgi:hypothetical protein